MMRRAEVRVEGGFTAGLGRVLAPEGGRDIPRVRVVLSEAPGALVLTMEAAETAALRAAINSYLRWMSVAQAMMEEVGS